MQSKAAADMRGPAGTGEAHTQPDRGATQELEIYEHLRMAAGLLLFFGAFFFLLVQGVPVILKCTYTSNMSRSLQEALAFWFSSIINKTALQQASFIYRTCILEMPCSLQQQKDEELEQILTATS